MNFIIQLRLTIIFVFTAIHCSEIVPSFNKALIVGLAAQVLSANFLEYDDNIFSMPVPEKIRCGLIPHETIPISYKTAGYTLSIASGILVLSQKHDLLWRELVHLGLLTGVSHGMYKIMGGKSKGISYVASNWLFLSAPFIIHEAVTKRFILTNLWNYIYKPLITSASQ